MLMSTIIAVLGIGMARAQLSGFEYFEDFTTPHSFTS
jgi:hypothetical protein